MSPVLEGLAGTERRQRTDGTPDRPLSSERRTELVVLAAFLAVTVYATWPLTAHLPTHVPGGLIDPLLNVWLFSWGAHAVVNAPFDLFDANLFFPEANSFAFTENMLGQSLPVSPIFWLTDNGILTVNVAVLAIFTAGAYGAYALARELGATRGPAFVAGLLFGFAPYRISQMNHMHVLAIHLIPFVLAQLVRLRRDPSRRTVLVLGGLIAFQFWSSLSGGVIMLVAISVFGTWELLVDRRRAVPVLRRAAAGTALGMVLVIPLLLPYLAAKRDHPEYGHPADEALTYSATPGSYLSPTPGGPLVRSTYRRLDAVDGKEVADWEKHLFPGLTLLVTLAVGGVAVAIGRSGQSRKSKRGSRDLPLGPTFGVAIAAAGFILSLGPRVGSDPDGLPLPFALLNKLVPGNLLRVPARFGSLVPLGLALAAALLLTALRPRQRCGVVTVIVVVGLLELMPTQVRMSQPPRIGDAVRSVSKLDGGVLTLPTAEVGPDGTLLHFVEAEPVAVYLSTGHFRPIMNGYSGFQPASWWEIIDAVQNFPSRSSLDLVSRRGVTTVIVLRESVAGTPWADTPERLQRWPGVRLVTEDRQAQIFDISGADLRGTPADP